MNWKGDLVHWEFLACWSGSVGTPSCDRSKPAGCPALWRKLWTNTLCWLTNWQAYFLSPAALSVFVTLCLSDSAHVLILSPCFLARLPSCLRLSYLWILQLCSHAFHIFSPQPLSLSRCRSLSGCENCVWHYSSIPVIPSQTQGLSICWLTLHV